MAKKGRPKGSKNHKYGYANAIPAVCDKCGSCNIKAVPGASPIIQNYGGTMQDGTKFTSIRKQKSICECGNRMWVRSYKTVRPTEKTNRKPISHASK